MVTRGVDSGDLVVVDTNVLLSATDASRTVHTDALRFLNEDPRRLALTTQIVREYLAVVTRPRHANGFGLQPGQAVENIQQLRDDMKTLDEGEDSVRQLMEFVTQGLASGKQIHDANVVAVAQSHGATCIVTNNIRHFERFAHVIDIEAVSG